MQDDNCIKGDCSLSKNPKLAARARKQRFAGLRGKCCGTRVRGSVPQSQSSSLALPCQILVSVDGCQSLAAFGSCIHWMRAPSRRPITPAGTVGEWVPSGHNRRRRLATRSCDTKRAGTTAVVPATIEWQQCLLHLHFFDTLYYIRSWAQKLLDKCKLLAASPPLRTPCRAHSPNGHCAFLGSML